MKSVTFKFLGRILIASSIFLFAACNGGGGGGGTTTYTVGGKVTGLNSGGSLTIALNGTTKMNLTKDSTFTFPAINAGSSYKVTIVAQPTNGETCGFMTNHAGINLSNNINSIRISCSVTTYSVSGTVTGLTSGQSIYVADLNDPILNQVYILGNGNFIMPIGYVAGGQYTIVISNNIFTTGSTAYCSISNGSGVITNQNITNVKVICSNSTYTVGGSTSLPSKFNPNGTVKIYLGDTNGADSTNGITLTAATTNFSFTQQIAQGSDYIVSIENSSSNYVCSVNNNYGFNSTANVTDVQPICSTSANSHKITVNNIIGLSSSDTISIVDFNSYSGSISAYSESATPSLTLQNSAAGYTSQVVADKGSYQLMATATNQSTQIARPCTFSGQLFATGTNVTNDVNINGLDCTNTNN